MNVDMKKIRLLISDVDGVWTDGTFYKEPMEWNSSALQF